jgi:cell division protein FtsI/penicillin-binding protein 2
MNISTNIRQLTNIFILLFLALSGALVYWQVAVAQEVTTNIHNSRSVQPANTPIRGNIFDRNGILLAYSKPDADVKGGYTRTYTDISLAGLIGYFVPGYPSTGIEKQYDDILSGRTGSTELGNTVNSILHRSTIGNDIYLTIDERIQQVADKHFDDPTLVSQTQQSHRGSVIITDPHTGEILAMVSRSSSDPNKIFDPNKMVQMLQQNDLTYYNQLANDPDNPLLERPIQGRYPPGSTYKTLTLLAGLDSGHTTLNEQFDEKHARGPVFFDGQPVGPVGNNIDGYTKHFPVNTEYGFAHSDNVIFAQIGVNTGFNTWMDYNKRFYVGQQIPFDLPVAVSTVLPQGQDTMADNELAAAAFGQGTDFVTPFQMSLIDNAVANNGTLMRPRLVSKVTDHQTITDVQKTYQGNTVQTFDQQTLGNPINQQTAVKTRQAMFGVTRCGSGSIVQDLFTSNVGIIAKTGTAQVGGAGTIPHGWMITQAPYSVTTPDQLPALTIVAMKENDGEGAFAVGPMIAHMYQDIFNNKYVPVQLPGRSDPNYCTRTGLLQ